MKISVALHVHACRPRPDLEPLLCLLKNNDRSVQCYLPPVILFTRPGTGCVARDNVFQI